MPVGKLLPRLKEYFAISEKEIRRVHTRAYRSRDISRFGGVSALCEGKRKFTSDQFYDLLSRISRRLALRLGRGTTCIPAEPGSSRLLGYPDGEIRVCNGTKNHTVRFLARRSTKRETDDDDDDCCSRN